jgi:iron(III) transport system ATP-binding protein
MSPADLIVVGVHKSFGPNTVLRGVDLKVPAGAFVAILGPSGSGKTTLLRTIAGFERPDDGSIQVGDDVLDDRNVYVAPEHRHIGYVSQNGSLFPHLTVAANVRFGLPRSRRHTHEVDQLLDIVDLGPLATRFPHQLSGGQQQRVALARALAVEPRIILLDEPFASLDASARIEVRSDVQRILRNVGATAILVTHDQDEALSLADSVAVIRDGRIVQNAAPRDLYESPSDVDVARFVGDANLVSGTVEGSAVRTALGILELHRQEQASPGQVTVLVRPEQITLVPVEPGNAGVTVRVLEANFHGHDTVYAVACDALGEGTSLTVRVLGTTRFGPGDVANVEIVGTVNIWNSNRR